MIADSLDHASHYASHYAVLHPAFRRAFTYLAAFDPSTPDGNYPFAEGCEARVMSYRTASAPDKVWESHRRFIDIQYVVAGRERMDVADVRGLAAPTPYDEQRDVIFYAGAPNGATSVLVGSGEFTVFFPHDGHCPGIAIGAPDDIRKVVIKVPVIANPAP